MSSGLIGVLGATGFTGRLVVAELERRGLPHRRGARSAERLASLPTSDAGEPFVVDVADRSRLDAFFAGLDVVINTVGPFARLGMPVVEAAVDNGVAYLDSTGEFDFMDDVYLRFADAPVPVVPACGFDYIPGDLAAAIAAADAGEPIAEVTVSYDLLGVVPSRGTARTAVEAIQSTDVQVHVRPARFEAGERTALQIPWGERVTVPRHVSGADVATVVGLPGLGILGPVIGLGARLTQLAAPLAAPLVERLPEGPPERLRRRSRFTVVAEARAESGRRAAVLCRGSDAYGLTARFLVEAAGRLQGRGAMTPAQALAPIPFLDAVSGDDPPFSWRRL